MNIDNYVYYQQHNGKTGIFSILLLPRLAFRDPSAISFPGSPSACWPVTSSNQRRFNPAPPMEALPSAFWPVTSPSHKPFNPAAAGGSAAYWPTAYCLLPTAYCLLPTY